VDNHGTVDNNYKRKEAQRFNPNSKKRIFIKLRTCRDR